MKSKLYPLALICHYPNNAIILENISKNSNLIQTSTLIKNLELYLT